MKEPTDGELRILENKLGRHVVSIRALPGWRQDVKVGF